MSVVRSRRARQSPAPAVRGSPPIVVGLLFGLVACAQGGAPAIPPHTPPVDRSSSDPGDPSADSRRGEGLPDLFDLDGVARPPLAGARADSVSVFVFTKTSCPIANRYAPELRRIHEAYSPRGVHLIAVYTDPREDPEQVRRHLREYDLPLAGRRDPERCFAQAVGATVTPEVVVFLGEHPVYRGRIDDQYVDFDRVRAAPQSRDLRDVLDALCAGERPAFRTTEVIGCPIPPRR